MFDDTSPYIQYKGTWLPQQMGDPFIDRYQNATFHSTTNDGDTATITFVGTDIQVYGAFRPNHGFFSGQIDGNDKVYENGTARDPERFQAILFEAHDLVNTTHTVVVTNEASYQSSDFGGLWFDLDFVAINGTPIAHSNPNPTTSSGSATNTVPIAFQTTPPDRVGHPTLPNMDGLKLATQAAPSLRDAQKPLIKHVAAVNSAASPLSPLPSPLITLWSMLVVFGLLGQVGLRR